MKPTRSVLPVTTCVFCSARKETIVGARIDLSHLDPLAGLRFKKGDFILIPGIDFRSFKAGDFAADVKSDQGLASSHLEAGISVGSICSGALILAEAGILDGKKCTTHWKCVDYMKERYPSVNVQTDQLYVNDRNVFTSAGMTSGIDMALSILERQQGRSCPPRSLGRSLCTCGAITRIANRPSTWITKTHFNPAIHRVQDFIISHPRGVSAFGGTCIGRKSEHVRNLTRLFRKATGHTIVEFKNAVKIELARNLVHNADYTVEKIADMCGFRSARHLRRVWGATLGSSQTIRHKRGIRA